MRKILIPFVILITINCYAFVNNLTVSTNSNILIIRWEGPTNYTEGTLYYNIYSSKDEPSIRNNKISGIEKFDLVRTFQYSTNNIIFSFPTTLFDRYYIVIPITNGKSILDWNYNIIPQPESLKELSKKDNIITNQLTNQPTNQQEIKPQPSKQPQESIPQSQPITTNTQITITPQETTNKITLSPNTELGLIIKNFFLKKDYKTSLQKLSELLQTTDSNEEQELIKLYIARCYYALNKKRKAIYILLNINSEEVKPLAEFWLNRYSKYFH